MNPMTANQACKYLRSNGWVEYKDNLRPHARVFYKRFETPTRCHCNQDKPGMQVSVSVSEFEGVVSFELDLRGELKDETSVQLKSYSLPKSVELALERIPLLLSMWETANSVVNKELT